MGLCQRARGDHVTLSDTAQAFEAYEAVRHRLPQARKPGRGGERAETLDDIADLYDAFFLDAFGVLNIGETAIPDVAERVASLQARNKRVLVVSNAASVPQSALLEKYQRLGYQFDSDDVVTSRAALLRGLEDEPHRKWGVMSVRSSGLRDLERFDLTYLGDDPAAYDAVEGFVLIGSADWTDARQTLLENALRKQPRPVFVGNPDMVAPRETGFSTEPGHYAHQLADRTGISPDFFGKPFENIYDRAFRRIDTDIPRARVLMVGDSLHTDILGAQHVGIASALISTYGFFAGADVVGAIEKSGICPDHILTRP